MGLFSIPPLQSPSIWTEIYHDAKNVTVLNEVRGQQVMIDMKRYVFGSGIASIDTRDQKQRMEDIRNFTGLDLETILGDIDDYNCDDCTSIFSPGAYLTEIIRFLPENAKAALLSRRPDLDGLLITCANTNVTLPYLDLVNEIMAEKIWQLYEKSRESTPNPFTSFNTEEDADAEDLRGTPTNQLPTLANLLSVYTLPPFSTAPPGHTIVWNPSVRMPSAPFTALPCDVGIQEAKLYLEVFKIPRYTFMSIFRNPFDFPLANKMDSPGLASTPAQWLTASALQTHAAELLQGQTRALHRALAAEYLNLLPVEYLAVTQQGFWSVNFWNIQFSGDLQGLPTDHALLQALAPIPPVHVLWGYPSENSLDDLMSLEHGFIPRANLSYDDWSSLVKSYSIGRYNQLSAGNQLFKDNTDPIYSPFDVKYRLQINTTEDLSAVLRGIQAFLRLKTRTQMSVVELDTALFTWQGYDAALGCIRPSVLPKLAALKEIQKSCGIKPSALLILWSDIYDTGDAGLAREIFGHRNIRRIDPLFTDWIQQTFCPSEPVGSQPIPRLLRNHVLAMTVALGITQADLLAVADLLGLEMIKDAAPESDDNESSMHENAILSTRNLSMLLRHVILARCFGVSASSLQIVVDLFPDVLSTMAVEDGIGATKPSPILHRDPERTLICLRQWTRISAAGLTLDELHALVGNSLGDEVPDTAAHSKVCFHIANSFVDLGQEFPAIVDTSTAIGRLEKLLPHLVTQDIATQILAFIHGSSTISSLDIPNDTYGITGELERYTAEAEDGSEKTAMSASDIASRLYGYLLPFVVAEEKSNILSKTLLEVTQAQDVGLLEFGLEKMVGSSGNAQAELDALTSEFDVQFQGMDGSGEEGSQWMGVFNPETSGQYSFGFASTQAGDVFVDDLPAGWINSRRLLTKPVSISAEQSHKILLPSTSVELFTWIRGTPRPVGKGTRNTFLPLSAVAKVGKVIQALGRIFGPSNKLDLNADEVRFWQWHGERRIEDAGADWPTQAATTEIIPTYLPWGSRHAPVDFTNLKISSIEQLCEFSELKRRHLDKPILNDGTLGENFLRFLKIGSQGRIATISRAMAAVTNIEAGVFEILLRIYGGLDPRKCHSWDPSQTYDVDDEVNGPQSNICNEFTILQIFQAWDYLTRLQVNTEALKTLLQMAQPVSDELSWTASTVQAINLRQFLRTRVSAEEWNQTITPVNDGLRRQRRDAMIGILLHDPELKATGYTDADGLFEYFYLDVQMDTSLQTSRIKQAISTVSTFVERALLGLETAGVDEDGDPVYFDEIDRTKWAWLGKYRVWEANRKVLAYPENYITASSLDQKTTLFKVFESVLSKATAITQSTVQMAMREYLHSLAELSHLDYVSYDFSTQQELATSPGDGSGAPPQEIFNNVSIFARTKQKPWIYFSRIKDFYYGWSSWQRIELPIPITVTEKDTPEGSWLIPFQDFGGRQLVFMPTVVLAYQTEPTEENTFTFELKDGNYILPPRKPTVPIGFEVSMNWSELVNGSWRSMRTFQQSTVTIKLPGKIVREIIPRLFFTTELMSTAGDQVMIQLWGDADPSHSSGYTKFANWTIFLDQMDASFNYNTNPGNGSSSGTFGITYFEGVPPLSYNTVQLSDTSYRVIPAQLEPDKDIHEIMVQISKGPIDNYKPEMMIVQKDTSTVEALYIPNISKWLGSNKTQTGDSLLASFGVVSDVQNGVSVAGFGGLVSREEPDSANDFDIYSRPYSAYYWEIGLFIPMLASEKFLENQQFDDALAAVQVIFDPRAVGSSVREPNWKFRPFQAVANASPQALVESFRTFKPTGRHLEVWSDRPFEAHVFSRARITTYMSWVVMKYIEILIAYGDFYFRQDTLESIPGAIQCYIEATQSLGKRARLFPRPKRPSMTLKNIRNGIDTAGVAVILEVMKDVLSEAGTDQQGNIERETWLGAKTLASTYFCMPSNPKLGQLRDTVEDRLFKIRHSMDIIGNTRVLALFEPSINPSVLVSALARGSLPLSSILSELDAPLVNVRFANLVARAKDICNFSLRSLGGLSINSMKDKDENELANILARQNRETEELKLVMVKIQNEMAVQTRNILLSRRKNLEQQLKDHLTLIGPHSGSKVPGLHETFVHINTGIADEFDETANTAADEKGFSRTTKLEKEADDLNDQITHMKSRQQQVLSVIQAGSAFLPEVEIASQPAGLGIALTVDYDNAVRALGDSLASALQSQIEKDSTDRDSKYLASQRRERLRGWRMSANVVGNEIIELDHGIKIQDMLIAYSDREISLQESSLASTIEIENFQRTRTTNASFYTWVQRSVRDVYYQTYNVAYDLAKKAERAYFFEKGLAQDSTIPVIEFYWDNTNNGLFAGERLTIALHKLEQAFSETRGYDFEVVKKISLKRTAPEQLGALQSGQNYTVRFNLTENMFDRDFPGHFRRRIKKISLSLKKRPVAQDNDRGHDDDESSNAGLAATLTLMEHKTRVSTSIDGGYREQPGTDARFRREATPINAIAVSDAADDQVLTLDFCTCHVGESSQQGYTSFEGAGAVSSWVLEFSKHTGYDMSQIVDIIVRMKYTSSGGQPLLRQAAESVLTSDA